MTRAFEGNKVMLGEPSHKIVKVWHGGSRSVVPLEHTWKCPVAGSYYHLWFWGRQLGAHGRTQWSASGWEAKVGTCRVAGSVDMSPPVQAGEPEAR